MDVLKKSFRKIKRLLDSDSDIKENVNGFYFNGKAITLLENTNKDYFMNGYYNLTIDNVLNMVDEANNIEDVKNNLLTEYQEYYALAWYENFCEILKRIA